jgi:hypothetical protein
MKKMKKIVIVSALIKKNANELIIADREGNIEN